MATPHLDALELVQLSTPASPPSGRNLVYFKSDGNLYIKDSSGNESRLARPSFQQINPSTTGAIAAAAGDVVNVTGTATVTLPAAPVIDDKVLINRVNHTNTITLAANTGETVNGQSSVAAATHLGTNGNYSGQILCIAVSSTEWIAIGAGTDLGLGFTIESQLNVNGPFNFNGALQAHNNVQSGNYATSFNDFLIEFTATATATLNSFGGGIQVIVNSGTGTVTVAAGSGLTMAASALLSIGPNASAIYFLDNANVWQTVASFGPPTGTVTSTPDFFPAGWSSETYPRALQITSSLSAFTSGTLAMQAIYLGVGTVVSNLNFNNMTTAAGSPTHWWMALYDRNRNMLARTADQTTGAIASNTTITKAIAATAAGAVASFTTTYSGLYYIGIMIAATTVPTPEGRAAGGGNSRNQSPILNGNSDTGQTTPPSFPHTAGAITSGGIIYAGTS